MSGSDWRPVRVAPASPLADTAAEPPPVGASFGIVDGLYWLVAELAARAPVALVVDDAHWADAPSLRFLGHLLRRLDGLPVGVVLALRPDEPGTPTSLLDPLRLDPRADVVTLHPLSAGAVGWLVGREGADAALVGACHHACAGNPPGDGDAHSTPIASMRPGRTSSKRLPSRA